MWRVLLKKPQAAESKRISNHNRDMNYKKRKTILFFDHTAKLGGGEIALLHLVQRLDARRFLPVVVVGEDGPFVQKLRSSGIETHVIALASNVAQTRKDSLGGKTLRLNAVREVWNYVRQLAQFMKRRRVDLVHANSLKADILGGFAARLARIPVVWHVRDRIEDDYLPRLAVRVFRVLCRVVPDAVIVNSRATLQTLHFPPPHDERKCRNNSRRVRRFVVHDGFVEQPETASAQSAMPNDAPLIGIVGRISPWKGQRVFVEAAQRVREKFPQARFQIIGSAMFGEADYERETRVLASSLGLDKHLEWLGFRSDVPQLMRELDVLVHASTSGEPFGQVIIEGMSLGVPVVATRGGAVPEIIRQGETGMMVPMDDAHAMADAITDLLSNPQTARAIAKAGQQHAREHFSIDRVVQKVQAIYDRF